MLRPHEAEALLLAKHRPTYCLQILSETLKVGFFLTRDSSYR